jgi:hypothetical protein
MNKPAQNVGKVIELAERRRDEALGELARAQVEQRQATEQMDQLAAMPTNPDGAGPSAARRGWTRRC